MEERRRERALQARGRFSYGARHHNWPLFVHVIAAVLLSDVELRQLRFRCKAGNESYPTLKTACACDVRLLNYAWNNADWLTGDLWSGLSANHQRLRCNGSNGHPMLLSNAQILRRGHAAGGWSRSEKTRLRNAIAPACCPSVPFNMFKALVVLLNVLRAATTESPTQLAVVDQRSCGRDAPPKWNLPATTRLQQVGARSGIKIVFEPLLDGREATVVHAVLVSWQQTSSGQLQWSRWIGFQDWWCFSSVSFLCGVTSCPWFRPQS